MSKTTVFNLAELSYNNTIQLKFKVDEDGVTENLRGVVDSRQDLSEAPQLVQDIAAEFPFTEHTNPDGTCCWADFIRVVDAERHHICYQESKYIYKDGKVTTQEKQPVVVVTCLDDLSEHSEKVQRFCKIVFTDEVKAAFIASLPRVEEPVIIKQQATVDLPVMIPNPDHNPEDEDSPKKIQKTEDGVEHVEATTVLDGAVRRKVKAHDKPIKVGVVDTVGVVDEDGEPVMEDYDTGETETFIQYNGKLYPEDWKG